MNRYLRPISLISDNPEKLRQEIKKSFHATFDTFESLYSLLKNDEAFYNRPEPLRHPHIFYFGHTAVFFINKLVLAKIIDKRVNPKLESIFAIGVDEMSWDDLNDEHYEWPSVEETREYRNKVRKVVDNVIESLPVESPITWDSPWLVILMGIEHERIHIETSSVLIRQTDISLVSSKSEWKRCTFSGKAPKNELLFIKGAEIEIGKSKSDDYYGWDNEYGSHKAFVPDFKASKYLVSNGEFLEFVEDGGYENDEWWEEEGLRWRKYKNAKHPVFWIPQNGKYRYRALTEIIDLPFDWPVDVNYHEAKAFCNWLSAKRKEPIRLPTEDEWYRLLDFCKAPDLSKWGEKAPANINLEHYAIATFIGGRVI